MRKPCNLQFCKLRARSFASFSFGLIFTAAPALGFADNSLTPILVTSQNKQTINQLEFASSPQQTADLLRKQSGIEAQRLGGHGLDLLIRGQGKTAINLLIDGGKIEGACPNRMDPASSYTNLNSFDQITIIKGVQSLQYGVGGTAGTVILERSQPKFTAKNNSTKIQNSTQGNLTFAGSNNGLQHDFNADLAAGSDKFFVVLQAADSKAGNYRDGNRETVKSAYHSKQAHLDLGFAPAEHQLIKISHEVANTKDALYQGAGMDAPKSDGKMTRFSYQAGQLPGLVNGLDLNFYHSKVDHLMDNYSLRPAGMTKMAAPSTTTTQGGKFKLTSYFNATQIDYGFILQDIEKQAVLYNKMTGKSRFLLWPNAQTKQTSFFTEATTDFGQQSLIYGVRLDRVNAKINSQIAPDSGAANHPKQLYSNANANYSGKTSLSEHNLNGLLRYENQLNSSNKVFVGLSQTYRTADETERFIARDNWTGNPDLKPEQHQQLDLGFSRNTLSLNWQANLFFDQVNNYILRDKSANQAALKHVGGEGYVNIDAKIYGAEFDWDWQFNQAWLRPIIGGNLAITRGKNTTDNRDLSDMSPLNGLLFAKFYPTDNQAWFWHAELQFASKQTRIDKAYGEQAAGSWQQFNLFTEYQINREFKISAGVDNLFNQAYFTHQNRMDSVSGDNYKLMEPGRSIWAKLQVNF